jgi:hypothetical protein
LFEIPRFPMALTYQDHIIPESEKARIRIIVKKEKGAGRREKIKSKTLEH